MLKLVKLAVRTANVFGLFLFFFLSVFDVFRCFSVLSIQMPRCKCL